jgi:hypothetical protein
MSEDAPSVPAAAESENVGIAVILEKATVVEELPVVSAESAVAPNTSNENSADQAEAIVAPEAVAAQPLVVNSEQKNTIAEPLETPTAEKPVENLIAEPKRIGLIDLSDLFADIFAEKLDEEEKLKRAGVSAMYDIDPKKWGRHFWRTLHMIAYAYPESPNAATQQAAFNFLDALHMLLPCSTCRENYAEKWKTLDLRKHLHTRTSLIEWMILLHDSVNQETGAAPLDYAGMLNSLMGITDAVVTIDSLEQATAASDAEKSTADISDSKDKGDASSVKNAYMSANSSKTAEKSSTAPNRQPSTVTYRQGRRSLSAEPKVPKVAASSVFTQTVKPSTVAATSSAAAAARRIAAIRAAPNSSQRKSRIQVAAPKPCPSCSGKRNITPSTF